MWFLGRCWITAAAVIAVLAFLQARTEGKATTEVQKQRGQPSKTTM